MAYWLFKSEPAEYSIDDLQRDTQVRWDSIRNYGARNRLQECEPGDPILFYHSGRNGGVVGVAQIESHPYPDPLQFDSTSDYFDPKANEDEPRWWAVDIGFVERFAETVTLKSLKDNDALVALEVLRQPRLSVARVAPGEWAEILAMRGTDPAS